MRKLVRAAAFAVGAAGLCAPQAHAVESLWTNGAGGSFETSGNWDNGVPGGSDIARFGAGNGTFTVDFASSPTNHRAIVNDTQLTLDLNGNAYNLNNGGFLQSLIVGENLGDDATLTITDGTLNSTGGRVTTIANSAGSTGTVNVGTGAVWNNAPLDVGDGGTGVVNHTGGTVLVGSLLQLGVAEGSSGTYNLSGSAALTSTGFEFIGYSGTGVFSHTNGTNNSAAAITLGVQPGSSGTYTLSNGTVTVNQGLTVGGGGAGTFNQNGGTQTVGTTLTVASDDGSSGTYTLAGGSLTAPALTVNANGHFQYGAGTLIGPTAVQLNNGGTMTLSASGTKTLETSSLAIQTGGGSKLNLNDNKLIVQGGTLGSWNGTNYTGLTRLVRSGRSGGTLTGPGIITSMTDALGAVPLTTLAIAKASDAGITTFGGESVAANDVLVMYTYAGDVNFNGAIDIDDYFQIDSNYGKPANAAKSYFNGDFNYDGNIDGDDYAIIDANFNGQGVAFGGISAVPEPTSLLSLGVVAAAGALRRRRRDTRSAS